MSYWELRERLNAYFDYWQWEEIFGIPSIFYKIDRKIDHAKQLTCPRCGKKGVLMQKTTVSKKKYKYKKWYVYHEKIPVPSKTSLRIQKWCYLNKNQMRESSVKYSLKAMKRARDIARYFYESIYLPNQK
jgi:DNA-directed RNA polymerase subunit RPC12/RpoP